MSLTFPKRGFAGAPVAGTLKTPGLTASDGAGVTFQSSTTLTGWTDITGGTFSGDYLCVTFGYGTATEEKILCTYNSATSTFTISQRGYDGTTAQAWTTGSLFILTWTATEAAELNAATQSLKTILTNSGTTTTPQPITVGSGTGAIGTGTQPAAIDHDHKISASTLNAFLGGASANATLNSSLLVPLANLVSGTMPTGVTTSQIWNPTATTTGTGPSQSGVTGFTKYIVVAWSTETTNASGNDQFGLSITIGATTLINPTKVTTATSSNGTVVTFAYHSTTATSTFAVSSVPTHGTPANVASQTHNLIVIGLN